MPAIAAASTGGDAICNNLAEARAPGDLQGMAVDSEAATGG